MVGLDVTVYMILGRIMRKISPYFSLIRDKAQSGFLSESKLFEVSKAKSTGEQDGISSEEIESKSFAFSTTTVEKILKLLKTFKKLINIHAKLSMEHPKIFQKYQKFSMAFGMFGKVLTF